MSRLTPERARSRAHQARRLSDFTPPQRRLLLALIEADTLSQRQAPGASGRCRHSTTPPRKTR
jgi:hypothetical protein